MTIYEYKHTQSGVPIYIEADEIEGSGKRIKVSSSKQDKINKTGELLETALDSAMLPIDSIIQKVNKLSAKPDEIEVNFSIKLSGEFNIFMIAKGSAESNFTIKAKWKSGANEPK